MALTIQSGEPVRSVGVATQFTAYTTPLIVAHQGGWDEILLIAGPIAVIAGLLVLAKKRVDAAAAAAEATRDAGTVPDLEPEPGPDAG
jgi:hypothetical protein